jgi:hydrogenase maturation protease
VNRGLLVLGIGNYLMGDEGVGVHAVRALEQEGLPAGVTLVDGGTGGFHLLEYLHAHDPIVMIDATMDGHPPGTVSVVAPRYPSDYPRTLTAHEFGLKDLIDTAAISGATPTVHLVTVSIAEMTPMHIELSEPVRHAIPRVIERVRALIAQHAS